MFSEMVVKGHEQNNIDVDITGKVMMIPYPTFQLAQLDSSRIDLSMTGLGQFIIGIPPPLILICVTG